MSQPQPQVQPKPEGVVSAPIPFIDLGAQRRRLGARVDAAILRVVDHGRYIMGPEVGQLEERLRDFCGARHAIACASGTDALLLGLMAEGIGRGDAVLVPSFTFASSAEVVALLGATPVFVDVLPETFNLDPAGIEAGVAAARAARLAPRAVMTVDLFGQPADYDAVEAVCAAHDLWLIADAAQSFGARYRDRPVGTIGRLATTSFFPAKPLGCYGDGGAVFTDDDAIAERLRSLRVHGKGSDKYDNVRIGINGRIDTLQAAVLIEKLAIFGDEIVARDAVAERYAEALGDLVTVPRVIDGATSVWAQYTVRVSADRDGVAARLKAAGVPTAIYYPKPLHQQTAYRDFPVAGNGLPVCAALSGEVLSLPMHPYLDAATQDWVIGALRGALDG